jgi:hypothetical protein
MLADAVTGSANMSVHLSKRLVRTLGVSVAAVIACSPALAHADDNEFYGLLRSRDMSPFGFLRLDMRPAHAIALEKGSWAAELELGYQNTWALSSGVQNYLQGLQSTGRRELGTAELAAIRNLPGENYLLDLESAMLDVAFHYQFTDAWSAYLITGAVSYQGGFLDGLIENFHQAVGDSSFGRPAVGRNDVNFIFDLKSAQVASFGSSTSGGYTDPVLGLRYGGFRLPVGWALSVEAAVKVPFGARSSLLSTGHVDYGLQASLQRRSGRQALYLDAAAVYYGGGDFPVPQDAQVIPTLIVGYERRLTDTTTINVQTYVSKSVYSHEQTDLHELTGTKYQYTLGLHHRMNRLLFSVGITENVQNLNNTPDIGFQLGLVYSPRPLHNL